MTCTNWRKVEDRIDWFLSHNPSSSGMCAQHSWHSLGGDYGCPPAWGCANANAIVDKEKSAGKLYTTDLSCPPRGALVLWKYGNNGHAALSLGDGTIATTDPSNGKMVGIEPITYPKKWGAANGGVPTGWSDYYNGVTFDVGGSEMADYWYSGKPSGTLKVGTSYVNLDIDEWDPAKSSIEHVLTYINCSGFKFKSGATSGRIRVRIDRGNGDYTGYQDYTVVPGQTELLITHTYFEKGDGTRTWVGFKCLDGLTEMTIGTRYMKRYTL